jgi:hypothetical protein
MSARFLSFCASNPMAARSCEDQAHGLRRGRDGEKAGRTSVSLADGSAGLIGIDHPARAPSTSDWRWNSSQATTKGKRRVDETGACDRKMFDPIASSAAVGVLIVPLVSPVLTSGFILSGLSDHARSMAVSKLRGNPFSRITPLWDSNTPVVKMILMCDGNLKVQVRSESPPQPASRV